MSVLQSYLRVRLEGSTTIESATDKGHPSLADEGAWLALRCYAGP